LLNLGLEAKHGQRQAYVENDHLRQRVPDVLVSGDRIEPWGVTDYMAALIELANALELPLRVCAEKFGTVTVRPSDNGWRYHPALGFAKTRK
jgi:CRISPR-associated endonuclease/helicase Cas3